MSDLTVIPPKLPVEYEQAVKALEACTHLDETKYWADKAEALAAWAKIYHSPDAQLKAKKLKLHAYRRMGEIAEQLRPSGQYKMILDSGGYRRSRKAKGPASLLREHGLKKSEAAAAMTLSHLAGEKFAEALENPQAPTTVAYRPYKGSTAWRAFYAQAINLRAVCLRFDPAEVARELTERRASATAKELVTTLTEWLDRFEQALPK